ncbi:MAG: heparinase II/III family protein [Myxococcaceae bacterium]|nr:heparinase II/III family protein [Myxococcaceae bacterium]
MSRWSYYTSVARLTPRALASAPVHRLQGLARQALYRRRAPLDAESLRASLGLRDASELPARMLESRSTRAWCEVSRRPSVLRALEALPGGRERAVTRAERVEARHFDLFGTVLELAPGQPVPWSLDPVSGHVWPDAEGPRLRTFVPGADIKYPWVLGRADWAVALAQGAWAARSEEQRNRFAADFTSLARDFLTRNPVGRGVHWSSTMEVALRAANLAQALVMLADTPAVRAPAFLAELLCALGEHAAWVEAHLEDGGAVPNNHLVADFVGLLVVGSLFPALPGAARWRTRAAEGLARALLAQVHPDGLSFEGSVAYHRLALELFTLAWLVAAGTGSPLTTQAGTRLRSMFGAAAAITSERGLAPQVGDNDSGRAWPLEDRASLDFSYLAPLGAALFGDTRLKEKDSVFPVEAAWLLGAEGMERFQALTPEARPRSVSFDAGGLHVLRGGGAFVAVSAGPQGQRGVGGHSHHDKLSFELHLGGVPVLVDCGTGTYTRDPGLRNRLRGTAMHNTPVVDSAELWPLDPARLFALPDATHARVDVFVTGEALDRLVAHHEGYRRLSAPVSVVRMLLLDKRERALCVVDALEGRGVHTVDLRLHLPDAEARLRAPEEEELARALRVPEAPRTFGPVAVELGPAGAPRALVLPEAGVVPRLEPSQLSPDYGRLKDVVRIAWRMRVQAPARVGWVVLFL